jgi:hypothetical protein
VLRQLRLEIAGLVGPLEFFDAFSSSQSIDDLVAEATKLFGRHVA